MTINNLNYLILQSSFTTVYLFRCEQQEKKSKTHIFSVFYCLELHIYLSMTKSNDIVYSDTKKLSAATDCAS